MFRLIAAAVLGVVAALPARAADPTTFTLDNGMEVVVLEDHRAPLVVHMVWYRVGAADEPPGKSGIAHFLEHLLFKGTDKLAAGEFSETVALNGGSDNAFTSQDYTAYFQRVAADRLGLMMEMEADRMRNLKMTDEDFATEKQVVLEERNMRIENDPNALFSEQRDAAQYLNHPYGIPTIGWKHEIEALTRDDAYDFYAKYYAPNNAILVVAGDVDPQDVRALANTHYGPLAPSEGIEARQRPQEPPQLSERRLMFSDPRVAQPYLSRSYLAPERDAGDQQGAAALTILSQLLGGSSNTSVLGRKLQFESDAAVYVGSYYRGQSYDDTTFTLIMVPRPGLSLAQGETALDAALAEFLTEGVDPDQLARVKMKMRAAQIYGDDNIDGLARRYGAALTSGLTLEDVEAWPDVIDAVTAQDVMAAAKALFDPRKSVTGWVSPETTEQAEVSQ